MSARKFRFSLLSLFLLGEALIYLNSAYAQNRRGDYFKVTLPVDPFQPEYVISQWRVIHPRGLNCRSNAGIEFNVVKVLRSGESFQVKTSEDRDQHNNPTKLDSRGLPWFMVTNSRNEVKCFIRGNSQYSVSLTAEVQPNLCN